MSLDVGRRWLPTWLPKVNAVRDVRDDQGVSRLAAEECEHGKHATVLIG